MDSIATTVFLQYPKLNEDDFKYLFFLVNTYSISVGALWIAALLPNYMQSNDNLFVFMLKQYNIRFAIIALLFSKL